MLYLTFDAGFENGCTAPILDALKKHKVPATFFLVGNYLETQPDLVRRMVEEGHTVGNHTYSHPDMSAIADEGSFRQELEKNEALYRELTGQEMPKLSGRPREVLPVQPGDGPNTGLPHCVWSLAYVDWYQDDQPTRAEAFDKLVPGCTRGGSAAAQHVPTNVEILDELLTTWEGMGYTFEGWKKSNYNSNSEIKNSCFPCTMREKRR